MATSELVLWQSAICNFSFNWLIMVSFLVISLFSLAFSWVSCFNLFFKSFTKLSCSGNPKKGKSMYTKTFFRQHLKQFLANSMEFITSIVFLQNLFMWSLEDRWCCISFANITKTYRRCLQWVYFFKGYFEIKLKSPCIYIPYYDWHWQKIQSPIFC